MLVYGLHLGQRTWIPLISLCYFHYGKGNDALGSENQAHTLDDIVIGRSLTLNAILMYNPCNQGYYEPNSYRLDPHHIPSSVYSLIVYNAGLFISLHRNSNAPISKPYPPGTQVVNPHTNATCLGTVMDIPMDPNTSPHYLVQFDDGTTQSILASDMPSLIPKITS
jgi:hypothetical protein